MIAMAPGTLLTLAIAAGLWLAGILMIAHGFKHAPRVDEDDGGSDPKEDRGGGARDKGQQEKGRAE